MSEITYRAIGDVRGSCGHRHRTLRGAIECARLDQQACRKIGGYSDRIVERTDGNPLTEDQSYEADHFSQVEP